MPAGPDDRVRIVVRPLGASLPMGLIGLAGASFVLSAYELGWIAAADERRVGLLIALFAVPLQFIASLLAFLARDGASGSATGLLAATWLAAGVSLATSQPGSTSRPLGFLLLGAGGLILISVTATGTGKLTVGAAMAATGIRYVVGGVYELAPSTALHEAAGAVGLAVVAIAAYAAWAFELEDAYDRTVMPTLRRGLARKALRGRTREQLAGIQHEAGVRRRL